MYRMDGGRVRWPGIVDRAREIVNGYEGGVSLRQVMYRLVSQGLLANTPPMYRRLSSRMAAARREGRFPDLIDTLREIHVPPVWPNAGAFAREMPGWFRLDRTRGQSHALYVAAEKDTLRQLLTGWLADLGIPVLVVRGFGSQSYADVVRERTAADPPARRPAVRRSPGLRRVWCDDASYRVSPGSPPHLWGCRDRCGMLQMRLEETLEGLSCEAAVRRPVLDGGGRGLRGGGGGGHLL